MVSCVLHSTMVAYGLALVWVVALVLVWVPALGKEGSPHIRAPQLLGTFG